MVLTSDQSKACLPFIKRDPDAHSEYPRGTIHYSSDLLTLGNTRISWRVLLGWVMSKLSILILLDRWKNWMDGFSLCSFGKALIYGMPCLPHMVAFWLVVMWSTGILWKVLTMDHWVWAPEPQPTATLDKVDIKEWQMVPELFCTVYAVPWMHSTPTGKLLKNVLTRSWGTPIIITFCAIVIPKLTH